MQYHDQYNKNKNAGMSTKEASEAVCKQIVADMLGVGTASPERAFLRKQYDYYETRAGRGRNAGQGIDDRNDFIVHIY